MKKDQYTKNANISIKKTRAIMIVKLFNKHDYVENSFETRIRMQWKELL